MSEWLRSCKGTVLKSKRIITFLTILYLFLNLYLFIWNTQRETSQICFFTPQIPMTDRELGQSEARGQELSPGLLHGWQGRTAWVIICCLPECTLARSCKEAQSQNWNPDTLMRTDASQIAAWLLLQPPILTIFFNVRTSYWVFETFWNSLNLKHFHSSKLWAIQCRVRIGEHVLRSFQCHV